MTPDTNCTIGIALITYGRRQALLDTIEQLKAQTWQDWRAVVVDQNPEPVPFRPDERITAIWQPDEPGLCGSRNRAMMHLIDVLHVRYLCFWDDDDVFSPKYLGAMAHPLVVQPRIILTRCGIRHKSKIGGPEIIATPSRMVRADAVGDKRWMPHVVNCDSAWWKLFDGLAYRDVVGEVLITTGNSPIGGCRHPKARL